MFERNRHQLVGVYVSNAKITVVRPMNAAFASEGVLRIDKIASGVGIIIFNAKIKQAAGLHVLRGFAPTANPKVPSYYADTGIAQILDTLQANGAKDKFSIAIAGGASMLSKSKFRISQKLPETIKNVLNKSGLTVKIEKIGGSQTRSMILDINAGKLKIV